MIALQSLKYKIFEWCIDTLVNKLFINFDINNDKNKKELDINDIRQGMLISEITCTRQDWVVHRYRQCRILFINDNTITFSYEQYKIGSDPWEDDSGIPTSWSINTDIYNHGVHFYKDFLI